MGYINGNNQYALITNHREYNDRYCLLGLYCSDTDLVEAIVLPERKRILIDIFDVSIVKDKLRANIIKLLYDK